MKRISPKSGFTLIEVLVVIAILAFIISLGTIFDINSIKLDSFNTERATIVSLLEKARSRSMTNMFQTSHGLCYIAPNYILFRTNCVAGSATNELISANTNIASNPSTTLPIIIFDQLTGNNTGGTIHITDGTKSADITINNEGTINW